MGKRLLQDLDTGAASKKRNGPHWEGGPNGKRQSMKYLGTWRRLRQTHEAPAVCALNLLAAFCVDGE
ncbi:MAG: hypothetical protein Q8L22_04360 [Reyranella sp.]|nr:hypothetical protein [Reyranella sp.]